MAASLLAKACPAIQVPASLTLKRTAFNAGPLATLPVSLRVPGTNGRDITPQINSNAAGVDVGTEIGGAGAYAVGEGIHKITLSVPTSGLALAVSAGHATVGGLVEIYADTTLTVPDNTGRIWIWLAQNGALSYATTTTAPGAAYVLLGSCRTAGGNVVDVDTSGVMYLRGGMLWRETAEEGAPGDTPPASIQFFARTAGGLYFWDGESYRTIEADSTDTSDEINALTERIETAERLVRTLIRILAGDIGITEILRDEEIIEAFDLAVSEAA